MIAFVSAVTYAKSSAAVGINEICYPATSGEFVALHAKEGGYKRINLPDSDFKAENALTGEAVEVNDMFIDIKMEKEKR